MKAFTIILKILAALAAIAGIVYVAATYGDKIVAWAKKLIGKAEELCCGNCDCNCQCDDDCDNCPCTDDCDTCPCDASCNCGEEPEPAEEAAPAPAEDGAVSADDGDFEG